jgi:hypothetical protein
MRCIFNRRISMNKKITLLTIGWLVVSIFLIGSRKEQQELYLKAMGEKDAVKKMELLKEYIKDYGDKEDKFLKFAYLNVANTAFTLKNYDETIEYGETAIQSEDLDAANKLLISLALANSYYATKRDMEKAYQHTQTVIDLANSLVQQARGSSQDEEQTKQIVSKYENYYIAPAYRLQGLILYFKDKDNPANIKQAAEKAIEAYKHHNSEIYSQMAFSLAGNLAQKNKFDDAIAIAETIFDKNDPKLNEVEFLAKLYAIKKDKDKSTYYYEMAYKLKPNRSLAMKIGQLVHKKDALKAIQYFADAYVLAQMNKETDAFKYLEHLYFNQVAKDKTAEEKEAGFNQIIAAAKARRGIKADE